MEGRRRMRRNPEQFGLRPLYASQDESRELIELALQERLLEAADFHQQKQRFRLITTLGELLHLFQDIAYHTSLIDLGEEYRSKVISEIMKRKHLSTSIYLYAISDRTYTETPGMLPDDWSDKQKEQRKDLALKMTILFLQDMSHMMKNLMDE